MNLLHNITLIVYLNNHNTNLINALKILNPRIKNNTNFTIFSKNFRTQVKIQDIDPVSYKIYIQVRDTTNSIKE